MLYQSPLCWAGTGCRASDEGGEVHWLRRKRWRALMVTWQDAAQQRLNCTLGGAACMVDGFAARHGILCPFSVLRRLLRSCAPALAGCRWGRQAQPEGRT
jgi:hypothetical protein